MKEQEEKMQQQAQQAQEQQSQITQMQVEQQAKEKQAELDFKYKELEMKVELEYAKLEAATGKEVESDPTKERQVALAEKKANDDLNIKQQSHAETVRHNQAAEQISKLSKTK
jgi:hypothetical protein